MYLSSGRRTLGKIAATLGILQGAAWAIMSLAAIILYNWSPDLDPPTSYTKLVEFVLYIYFLKGPESDINFIIRPYDFTIFMWIYFFLSVSLFTISADLFSAIVRNKQRQTFLLVTWGTAVAVLSLIDLIFVCLLARDYSSCKEGTIDLVNLEYFCYLAIGIVMTVAARGYTLWFINVLFAVIILSMAAKIVKEDDRLGPLYSSQSIPRVKIPNKDQNNIYPRDIDFNTTSSFPREGEYITPTPTLPRSLEPSRTSFLDRGDKFTY